MRERARNSRFLLRVGQRRRKCQPRHTACNRVAARCRISIRNISSCCLAPSLPGKKRMWNYRFLELYFKHNYMTFKKTFISTLLIIITFHVFSEMAEKFMMRERFMEREKNKIGQGFCIHLHCMIIHVLFYFFKDSYLRNIWRLPKAHCIATVEDLFTSSRERTKYSRMSLQSSTVLSSTRRSFLKGTSKR